MSEVLTPERVSYRSAIVADQIKLLSTLKRRMSRHIIELLDVQGEMNQTDIWICLGTAQPQVSAILGMLERDKVVNVKSFGKHRIYSLNYETIERVQKAIKNFTK